jgi:hypothetical protein
MPTPLGKTIRIIELFDTNNYCDLVNRHACNVIQILPNQQPIDWYKKKQSIETCTTLRHESVAAMKATKKERNLRYTYRMMGIQLDYSKYVFSDEATVLRQCPIPHSQLGERHHALALHLNRAAIATGMIHTFHTPAYGHPENCKKPLGYHEWIRILRPVLCWQGGTATIPTKGE